MTLASESSVEAPAEARLEELAGTCAEAVAAADSLVAAAGRAVGARVMAGGRFDAGAAEEHQFALHGFAWAATYAEALRQLLGWAQRLEAEARLGELEALMLQAAFGEYLAQLAGGIPMSQVELVRPRDMGLDEAALTAFATPAVRRLIAGGNSPRARGRIAQLITRGAPTGAFGALGLDETLSLVREQFRRFADEQVVPHAHAWHVEDRLIPLEVIEQMSELGVFGLTVPEEWGGLGMGKMAMCVVSEELSRGYIGVGSLGTRSEIAAELVLQAGTQSQKERWLRRIASGEVIPTAVFTEPDVGSDLASLKVRAVREGEHYLVTGNKIWITHAARADLMTLLVRTDPAQSGYRGLSMFLAEKPRGDDDEPFPVAGMSGGEIRVLGYRGMKEYEIAFDGFRVAAEDLLGGAEGNGFKQLMATFESARIQTASRALGVGQSALELGLAYAVERRQFGKPIAAFPRVSGKLAWMATELMAARQLTYFAARQKDSGRRCDLEAGMAKLLAARVAWAAADNAVQIHGGNGYAIEYPVSRVLLDARILNIFEGTAEIQAQVIARRLLERGN
ncbi:MAG: acyl-CoA dehydrogenase family protein [Alphaproteobacteria bacterium]